MILRRCLYTAQLQLLECCTKNCTIYGDLGIFQACRTLAYAINYTRLLSGYWQCPCARIPHLKLSSIPMSLPSCLGRYLPQNIVRWLDPPSCKNIPTVCSRSTNIVDNVVSELSPDTWYLCGAGVRARPNIPHQALQGAM